MIGSIVSINDRNSDLYCNQGEIVKVEGEKAIVMVLKPYTLEHRQAWDCIVENVEISKLGVVTC